MTKKYYGYTVGIKKEKILKESVIKKTDNKQILNETLTTKDFRDLAVIFGSAATDNLSVKVMTKVVKSFIKLTKEGTSSFNEDRFITLLRKESPRLARALKGEKEPEGEDSETNESELNEGLNPFIVRDNLEDRLGKAFREMEDLLLGPAVDTREEDFDKPGVKKVLGLLKKIDSNLRKLEKDIDTLADLGL